MDKTKVNAMPSQLIPGERTMEKTKVNAVPTQRVHTEQSHGEDEG